MTTSEDSEAPCDACLYVQVSCDSRIQSNYFFLFVFRCLALKVAQTRFELIRIHLLCIQIAKLLLNICPFLLQVPLERNEEPHQPFLPGNTDTFHIKFRMTVSEPLAIRFVYRLDPVPSIAYRKFHLFVYMIHNHKPVSFLIVSSKVIISIIATAYKNPEHCQHEVLYLSHRPQ